MASIIALAVLLGLVLLLQRKEAALLRITVDGLSYQSVLLDEDQEIVVEHEGHRNVLRIKDGAAEMIEASCPDQLCVKQGKIKQAPESIVCLPNAIVAELIGEENPYDSIAK